MKTKNSMKDLYESYIHNIMYIYIIINNYAYIYRRSIAINVIFGLVGKWAMPVPQNNNLMGKRKPWDFGEMSWFPNAILRCPQRETHLRVPSPDL